MHENHETSFLLPIMNIWLFCPSPLLPWVTTNKSQDKTCDEDIVNWEKGRLGSVPAFVRAFYRVSLRCGGETLSPRYLHIPLRPHKEATLSPDQTRLYSHKFWFLSPDTKLSRVLSWVKGWLSPKLCDFCAALIQWLVLCPCDTLGDPLSFQVTRLNDFVKKSA